MAISLGITNLSLSGHQPSRPAAAKETAESLPFELVLPTEILSLDRATKEGPLVRALAFPWLEIFQQLKVNPDLVHQFSKFPRKFEEFVAASYEKDGFHVTLTPQSGDGGKDIIAEKHGFGAFRIIDQCKAFKKGRTVGPNDVRAMMGTLDRETNSSKAVITTTSLFAPSIAEEWKDYMPNRLELRDKNGLMDWLSQLDEQKS